MPVFLFFFGYFVLIKMILLSVFLAILINAYNPVHHKTDKLPQTKHHVFYDSVATVTCRKYDEDAGGSEDDAPRIIKSDSTDFDKDAKFARMNAKLTRIEKTLELLLQAQSKQGSPSSFKKTPSSPIIEEI